MDQLDLNLITTLSDKLLLNLFTELSSDEIRKVYTVTCLLEPDNCKHQIQVYGNEMKARIDMKHHLHKHLEKLKEVYKGMISQCVNILLTEVYVGALWIQVSPGSSIYVYPAPKY